VHAKLVGFMAAVPRDQPVYSEQLFANLFGHSGSRAA
jgi:hypothetical protein